MPDSLKSERKHSSVSRYLIRVALWAGLYFAAALVSRTGPMVLGGASFVWLPAGVGLAVILLHGYRYWPAIALGSILSVIRFEPSAAYLVGVTISHVAEACLGAWLLVKCADFRIELERVKDVLGFVVLGAVLATLTSATLITGVIWLTGFGSRGVFFDLWLAMWLSNVMGVLIVTPALLALRRVKQRKAWRTEIAEIAGLAGVLLAAILFSGNSSDSFLSGPHFFEFSAFPIVIWVALRFGMFGASIGNLLIPVVIVVASVIWAGEGDSQRLFVELLWLPGLILVLSITSLVVGAVTDERRMARDEARRSQQKFLRVFMASPYAVTITRLRDGCFLDVNERFEKVTGYHRDKVIGHTVNGLNIWAEPETAERLAVQLKKEGRLRDEEIRYRKKSGELREVLLSAEKIEIDGERCALSVVQDITERKQAAEALRENEERFRLIFDHSPTGMLVQDADGRKLQVNHSFCEMLGYSEEELRELSIEEMTHPDDRAISMDKVSRLEKGELDAFSMEKRYLRKDGSTLWAVTSVSVVRDSAGKDMYRLIQVQDLTARHQLEEQLRHIQKMDAVGQLAGGVAHDFNNLMMVIRGYNELTLTQLETDDPLRKNSEEIQAAVERAAFLTQQLLAYGRRQLLQPAVFDVGGVVSDVVQLLEQVAGKRITISLQLAPALSPVKADPEQIKQVLINLALNAVDAMPDGGVLTICAEDKLIDASFARRHAEMKPGSYVELEVRDTGAGMDNETLSHIFEPFFTTQERSKNAGLGLASVYGIVKQSGGHIWVESTVGKGSTFRVYLPQETKTTRG